MATLTDSFAQLPIWLAHTADKKPCSYIDGWGKDHLKPERWGTLAQVDGAIETSSNLVGRTIVCGLDLSDGSGLRLAAIDTDHCYTDDDPDQLLEWARPVHALLEGHLTETSKSGHGAHHFFLVDPKTLPEGAVSADYKQGPKEASWGFELYLTRLKPMALTAHMQGDLQVLLPEELAALLVALRAFAPPKEKAVPIEVALAHPRRSKRFDDESDYALAFEIVERLRNDYDWEGWFTLGGGFYKVTRGTEEAYRSFERFTERGGYGSSKDLKKCRELWTGFRSSPPVVDMGHLVNEAKQQGIYDDAMEAVFGRRPRRNGHDDGFHDYSELEPEAAAGLDVGLTVATAKPAIFDLANSSSKRWIDKPVPILSWLVAGLFPLGMCSIVGADSGAGKSILMQTLATCIAATELDGSGYPFLGHRTMGGRAVYITGEDPENILHMRQDRILRALNLPWEALGDRLIVRSMADHDIWLYQRGRPSPLAGRLRDELAAIPDLRGCFIDSAALVFDDEEIKRAPVAGFMKFLNRTAMQLDSAIVIAAHTSRSSRGDTKTMVSGSTAWVAQARAGVQLERKDEDGEVKLKLVNANYGKPGWEQTLVWTDDGVLVPKPSDGMVERIQIASDEKRVLDEITRAWLAKTPLSLSANAPGRFLPKVMSDLHAMKAGHAKKLAEVMMARGDLVIRTANKRSKMTGLCPKNLDPETM